MDNKSINIDGNIIIQVLLEIDDINGVNNKIDALNKLMTENLSAIYKAITEINLSDKESHNRIKTLVAKQKCYESVRKRLLTEPSLSSTKSKR